LGLFTYVMTCDMRKEYTKVTHKLITLFPCSDGQRKREAIYIGSSTDASWQLDCRQLLLSLLHSVQTDSGAHPASYPMRTRAEVKNAWNYTSTPRYVNTPWCLIKHKDNSTLLVMRTITSRLLHRRGNNSSGIIGALAPEAVFASLPVMP
jgi:hypothetical protein